MKKIAISLALIPVLSLAQKTQPITPQTPDVKVPPPVNLLPPEKMLVDISKPIDATQAAQLAIRYQQALRIAKAQVRGADGQVKTVRSAEIPSVSLSSTYSDFDLIELGNTPVSGNSTGYSTTVALKQLIFDFNHSHDLVRQAEFIREAAKQGYKASMANLTNDVKKAFYTAVANDGLVQSAEANVKARQNQYDLAKARLDSGIGAPADVISAKANLSDAVLSLTQARLSASVSMVALAQTMGLDPRTPIKLAPSSEPAEGDLDVNALVEEALKNRPEVAQALANQRAAQAGLTAAKTNASPALVLNAGVTSRGQKALIDSQYATFGLSLSWTLYDGESTRGKVEQAKASVESASASLELAKQSVISDVSQAYLNLMIAKQKEEVAGISFTNTKEAARLVEGRYREAFATFVEVTTAQASAFSAQNAWVNAKAAVDQARAALAKALGRN